MKRLALAFSLLMADSQAFAFDYEVLFEDTLGRQMAFYEKKASASVAAKTVLLDGQITTKGTELTTFDRILFNYASPHAQIAFASNLSLRITLPVLTAYEKKEGKTTPRIIAESKWIAAEPRLNLIYSTASALDILLGIEGHYQSGYAVESEAGDFESTDRYGSVFFTTLQLAVAKHASTFDAGFTFELSGEKKRNLKKTNNLDDTQIEVDDVVHVPEEVGLFYRNKFSFFTLFTEFAAIQASGGGNKTERGRVIREDYFRVQLGGAFNLMGQALIFEPTLIYKSLSYADNRNVTLDTIPAFALHAKLYIDQGIPCYLGLVGVRGSDGQSLTEFNAEYKLIGAGVEAGLNFKF